MNSMTSNVDTVCTVIFIMLADGSELQMHIGVGCTKEAQWLGIHFINRITASLFNEAIVAFSANC